MFISKYFNFKSYLFVFISILVITQTKAEYYDSESKIVNIHSRTKDISEASACDVSNWNNVKEDSCKCCLIKNFESSGKTRSIEQVKDICVNKNKQCDNSSLNNIVKSLKFNALSEDFLKDLENKALVVQNIPVESSWLNEEGYLIESAISKFLALAFKLKKIDNKDFSDSSCIITKNILKAGGYNTLQLFLVNSSCNKGKSTYILKEPKESSKEVLNLQAVRSYPGLKELENKEVKGYPTISLPIAYFSYKDNYKLPHTLVLMPAAKGKTFCELFIDLRDNPTEKNKEKISIAFFVLGQEMGNFQRKFMKPDGNQILRETLAHGDFKCANVFYDEDTGHISFIDNETMEKSLSKGLSSQNDLVKIFYVQFATNQIEPELIKSVDPKLFFDLTLKNFIRGYSEVYPANKSKQVITELKQIFNKPFSIEGITFNEEELNKNRKNYVNPIFDSFFKSKAISESIRINQKN